jgi:hypothetical protein
MYHIEMGHQIVPGSSNKETFVIAGAGQRVSFIIKVFPNPKTFAPQRLVAIPTPSTLTRGKEPATVPEVSAKETPSVLEMFPTTRLQAFPGESRPKGLAGWKRGAFGKQEESKRRWEVVHADWMATADSVAGGNNNLPHESDGGANNQSWGEEQE